VLPAAIKIGVKEARSFLTGPNYPIEEFVGFAVAIDRGAVATDRGAVATDRGATPLGDRLPDLKRRLQAQPDVAGVTFTASLAQRASTGPIEVEGSPAEGVPAVPGFSRVTTFGIDTDYLDVYGLHVVAGRPF